MGDRADATAVEDGAGPGANESPGRLTSAQFADVRIVVLVEGESDRAALLTLADRLSRNLAAEGAEIVAMNGITNTFRFAQRYAHVRLAGLYDAAEERYLYPALERAGVPADGFFACDPDLEYEFIRALGVDGVEAVIAAEGEMRSLELLAGMPAQHDWTGEQVLHRFLGVRSGRKARYARLLTEALPLDAVPRPLTDVLAFIRP